MHIPVLVPVLVAVGHVAEVGGRAADRRQRRVDRATDRVWVGLGRPALALEPAHVLALDIGVRQAAVVVLAPLVAGVGRLHAKDAVDVRSLVVEVVHVRHAVRQVQALHHVDQESRPGEGDEPEEQEELPALWDGPAGALGGRRHGGRWRLDVGGHVEYGVGLFTRIWAERGVERNSHALLSYAAKSATAVAG